MQEQKSTDRASLIRDIEEKAKVIRADIVKMTGEAGSGHPGGSLSSADILAALYFGEVLNVNPQEPNWPGRDRFLLSKGHAAPVLYSALARRGFFPVSQLLTLRQFGSPLQGHPDCRSLPGIEASTGSLGQGLSIAVGMALAGKLDNAAYTVWALLGDGECQEGQIWEAAMAASHFKLDNLVAIVDHNRLQIDGKTDDVMSLEPLAAKFEAFGWEVLTVDGHNVGGLLDVFRKVGSKSLKPSKPTAIIAETVKGKGISFMENQAGWHGKAPTADQVEAALKELGVV